MVSLLMYMICLLSIANHSTTCAQSTRAYLVRDNKQKFKKKQSLYDQKKIILGIMCGLGCYYTYGKAKSYAHKQAQLMSAKSVAKGSWTFLQDSVWSFWGYKNTSKFDTYKKDFAYTVAGTGFYSFITVVLGVLSIRLIAKGLHVTDEED